MSTPAWEPHYWHEDLFTGYAVYGGGEKGDLLDIQGDPLCSLSEFKGLV